ncbi:hypothetical protein [Sinomicrobium weinanense]|uniref:Uncharacterized protein n=1 Tax=Sinomicrobium weinanense TaxID=2842200 RepID=A0A926JR75_9FLAO|nr:hypothetical protein [Sinomicrobium weinanense]MBC9795756.1 hypothetical protein [Sinomicrobium weinanense]MBU3121800.1 hypothetical protein [Sinomicrobium weinanense]
MALYTNIKYMEWKSAEEMHEDARQWLSELEFAHTESHFLDELLGTYFIKLSTDRNYTQTKALVERLSAYKKQISGHIKQARDHQNELVVLLDGIDQPYEEREVKTAHKKLQQKAEQLTRDFRELKKEIFHTVYDIMRENNRKYLIGGKYRK